MKGSGRSLPIRIIPYLPSMIERNLKKPQSGYTCLDRELNRPACANLFGSDSVNRETNDAMRFRLCACEMPAEERFEVCLRHDAMLTGTQLQAFRRSSLPPFSKSLLAFNWPWRQMQQAPSKRRLTIYQSTRCYTPQDLTVQDSYLFFGYMEKQTSIGGSPSRQHGASSSCGWERPPIWR